MTILFQYFYFFRNNSILANKIIELSARLHTSGKEGTDTFDHSSPKLLAWCENPYCCSIA